MSKQEVRTDFFSCFHKQRKKEKTTLPNSSALAGAGNSTALFLITGIVCASRILEWKSLQQLALFISLSGAVLTIGNKLPLLQSRAFPCSFYTLTINNCVTKPDLVSGQSRKQERSRNSVSISPGGGRAIGNVSTFGRGVNAKRRICPKGKLQWTWRTAEAEQVRSTHREKSCFAQVKFFPRAF